MSSCFTSVLPGCLFVFWGETLHIWQLYCKLWRELCLVRVGLRSGEWCLKMCFFLRCAESAIIGNHLGRNWVFTSCTLQVVINTFSDGNKHSFGLVWCQIWCWKCQYVVRSLSWNQSAHNKRAYIVPITFCLRKWYAEKWVLCFFCCVITGRTSLRKFSISLQFAMESFFLFENISSDSLWFSVSREVGSNFIRTRVCSVNSKLMYFSGLKSLKTRF